MSELLRDSKGHFLPKRGKKVATKRGKATRIKASEIDPEKFKGQPVPEAPMLQIPVKRSQHCLRHNTMKIGGICKRCQWEKDGGPKRANRQKPENNVDRVSTGKTLEI